MNRIALLGGLLVAANVAWPGCDEAGTGGAPLLAFGRTGMGAGEFSYPRALATGDDARLYIVDKAARIQCLTPTGVYVREWRTPLKDAGKPTGLCWGPDNRLYVADTHYSRVLIYDPQGALLGQFGSFGTEPGQFGLPTDVAVTRDGHVYVSEYGNTDRISKFSPCHECLLTFGGPGSGAATLRRPQALLLGADETLWVADAGNHRICHFDTQGRLLGSFGREGSGRGELHFPYGLDWLSDGTLVVTEYGNNRVQRFTPAGASLGTWGRAGRRLGELAYPWASAVLPGDQIAILDSGNNRVQVISGADPDTWRSR